MTNLTILGLPLAIIGGCAPSLTKGPESLLLAQKGWELDRTTRLYQHTDANSGERTYIHPYSYESPVGAICEQWRDIPTLRLTVRHRGPRWVYAENFFMIADGWVSSMELRSSFVRVQGDGSVSETASVVVFEHHMEMLHRVINSRMAYVRILGLDRQQHYEITDRMKLGLRRTMEGCRALGWKPRYRPYTVGYGRWR